MSLSPARVEAQASASVTASATVTEGIAVSAVRNLGFGPVVPGFDRTILPTDATAGHFRVGGGIPTEVTLSFPAIPRQLRDGTNAMTVRFRATHNHGGGSAAGTRFDPVTGVTACLDRATGELHVYLGGTLVVPVGQIAGRYTATVTMSAAYTGN